MTAADSGYKPISALSFHCDPMTERSFPPTLRAASHSHPAGANAACCRKPILRQLAEGCLCMLVKHVPGTCGVRAGRGGASFVETLPMVYSTHVARSRFWLHKMLRLESRRNTLPEGFRKNLAELQQRIYRLRANTV